MAILYSVQLEHRFQETVFWIIVNRHVVALVVPLRRSINDLASRKRPMVAVLKRRGTIPLYAWGIPLKVPFRQGGPIHLVVPLGCCHGRKDQQ